MNILMVGHSRSGKTSFMAGMYKYLGEKTEGYGIKAMDFLQKINLNRMAKQLSYGKYPSGTDVQQIYKFSFTSSREFIVPFNLVDYRGGILLSDNPDDSDMDKFLDALKESDALVVFLDGEKLSDSSGKWTLEYDILLSCIERSLDVTHNSWFPISFVITKCDRISSGSQFYGLSRFTSLFDQISKSKKVGGMIVHSVINSDCYYTPFFVLAYSIYGGSSIYINKRIEAMENAQKRVNKHTPDTMIGNIFVGIEHSASRIAGALNSSWQWESELDLANEAKHDFTYESAKLDQLKIIADDLKEKLYKWSEDDIITFF